MPKENHATGCPGLTHNLHNMKLTLTSHFEIVWFDCDRKYLNKYPNNIYKIQ